LDWNLLVGLDGDVDKCRQQAPNDTKQTGNGKQIEKQKERNLLNWKAENPKQATSTNTTQSNNNECHSAVLRKFRNKQTKPKDDRF
jgi:hypothetical protein